MASGIVIGILKEQHSDHLVLTDASRVSFPDGLVLERFALALGSRSSTAVMMLARCLSRASPGAPRRTYVTSLHLSPPTVADGATPTREIALTVEDQTPRPNPICAVCEKSILPGVPRYRRGLTSVHVEARSGVSRSGIALGGE